MNPDTKQLQPLSPEMLEGLTQRRDELWKDGPPELSKDPATWDTLRVGQWVQIGYGGDLTGFTVDTVSPNEVRVTISAPPPAGKVWDLTGLPNHGARCTIGRMVFDIIGRTKTRLKLRPAGYVDELENMPDDENTPLEADDA